ncbi:MAG: hypothetical protein NZU63_13615 [Gemmataceae bacterium]|nr:hypothetical protein [Gemmataceae bacterium]MDW8244282.1 hypothetical protein [Thermogemmata sp.]
MTRPTGRLAVKLHRRVCVLMTDTAVTAEEVLARPRLAADIVGRLSPTVLLVRPGRWEAVVAELRKLGHAPRIISSGPPRPQG